MHAFPPRLLSRQGVFDRSIVLRLAVLFCSVLFFFKIDVLLPVLVFLASSVLRYRFFSGPILKMKPPFRLRLRPRLWSFACFLFCSFFFRSLVSFFLPYLFGPFTLLLSMGRCEWGKLPE